MRKLPFLNGIRAFEAAARASSFAKAADELHVTPAAVSRMVQLLEARLGFALFERKANRLMLTPAGSVYQAGLTQLFDQLANLTAQVAAVAGNGVLTIGVGPTFATRWLIPRLADEPMSRLIEEPFVASLLDPLLERHRRSIDILRERSDYKQGTIYFDITDHDLEGYNKFIPYYLYPDAIYSVGLSSSSFRVKVAVGSNPWTHEKNMVNLAKVCERYGGGGHARVGAISFPPDRGDEARKAAADIVRELRASRGG